MIDGSFVESNLQRKASYASLPHCNDYYVSIRH